MVIPPVAVKQLPAIVKLFLVAAATAVVYVVVAVVIATAVGVAAIGIVGVAAAVADSYIDSSLA